MSSSDRDLLLSDVRTIELAFERHALRTDVRPVARFRDPVAARHDVHDPTATHDEGAVGVALGRSMEREHVLRKAVESRYSHPSLRRAWIVFGAEDDVDVRALVEADGLGGNVFGQAAFTQSEEELGEI